MLARAKTDYILFFSFQVMSYSGKYNTSKKAVDVQFHSAVPA
jgi:hypothetical protein